MKNTNRRQFIQKMTGGILVLPAINSLRLDSRTQRLKWDKAPAKKYGPNDTIRFAGIGMGIQGFSNCKKAVQVPGAQMVAVCDLYKGRLARSKEVFGDHLFTSQNYKEILSRKDIDAVIVSTSDHWHDKISIEAMEAGKAVYCEKPMVHHINEGQAMIDAEKRTGKAVQVGSQRVSSILYLKAKELYERGDIGQLIMVEAYNDRSSANGAWQYSIPTDASTSTVDWENFIGDAPKQAYDPKRFFRWRNYQDYGTGVAGDLFVHLFSGIHLITSSNGPERIYSTGGLRFWKDGRDVPDVILGCFDYPESKTHPAFNLQLRVNFVDGGGGGSRTRLIGTEGIMDINWSGIKIVKNKIKTEPGYGGWDSFDTFSEAQQKEYEKWYKAKYPAAKPVVKEPAEMEYLKPEGYSDHIDHMTNFFNAARQGKTANEDTAFGLRAAAPSLACNMSYFEKKVVKWDPEGLRIEE